MALPSSLLCPIDFSAGSERALRHALALTAAFGAHLTVLTVNDPVLVAGAMAGGHGETLRDQVEAALIATLERMPAAASPLVPAIDIAEGDPAGEILASAARTGTDLVVIGTRGLGQAGRMMFGSTTEKVVRAAAVPVLAVPDYAPERMTVVAGAPRLDVRQVVAAIGLDVTDTTVAATAAAWSAACAASLTLAHIDRSEPAPGWWPFGATATTSAATDALRERLAALVRDVPATAGAAIDVRRDSIAGGIAALVRELDAGLLVVSRGGGQRRLGATAYRVMAAADVPTLVVPV